jgi:hypothetical protein
MLPLSYYHPCPEVKKKRWGFEVWGHVVGLFGLFEDGENIVDDLLMPVSMFNDSVNVEYSIPFHVL